ncbi:Glycosyltransferase involved in cell wall bisynthesis [Pacificibacter marinus]|uniref:N-acetylgalactosamine-N, N'-diacetylbacillosaminyl-diphospho-undecaprenol 4-alpha-N-acetylgalactosaminyltransferase n=1 Tax=Pacificibacter marinus TaxID=658057 RepID=A0A1Y5S202_9RHOB|nr:Glycosyltransferase involved in cell wall bisynthesis [Pacificibacter marinus]SLN29854.1 N-acetylgalactosamine-N, N'-diacetylbacillosaminyl-diphospho-undecaprenol 4-alpha-N-acetylgalactosaminyltransferase [Pacificibacter marinus]
MGKVEISVRHRICFVTDSVDGGGIGTVFLSLSQELTAIGCYVDLVLFAPPICAVPEGVNVVVLHTRARCAVFHLARQFRKAQPDLIVSARDYVNLTVLFARTCAGQGKTPLVWSFHTHQTLDTKSKNVAQRAMDWVSRSLSKFVNHLVAVSDGVARDMEERARLPNGYVKTIYNPVGVPLLKLQIAHPWLAQPQVPAIVACGRLVPQKDFQTLISAFVQLRKTHAVRLLILGEGPLRNQLQHQIDQTLFAGDIQLLGYVEDPVAFMKDAACFVSSAQWEGFGMAIAEAMAVGCPVVATDCPSGPREVLADGAYGTLVPVADTDALAKALACTLDSVHDPRPAQASLVRFDPRVIAQAYLELI